MLTAGLLLYALFLAGRFYSAWTSDRYGAPFEPLPLNLVETAIAMTESKAGERLIDLGSGDGRVLFAAVENNTLIARGIEIAWYPRWKSKLSCWQKGLGDKIEICAGNFYHAVLSEADIVYIYQSPGIHEKIKEKLEAELKPGTKVIAPRWPIPGWPVWKKHPHQRYPIYLYQL